MDTGGNKSIRDRGKVNAENELTGIKKGHNRIVMGEHVSKEQKGDGGSFVKQIRNGTEKANRGYE